MANHFLAMLLMIFSVCLISSAVRASPGVEALEAFQKSDRFEALLTHGVNIEPDELINFLENGFPEKFLRIGLPDEPQTKSQVYSFAIQELGFQQSYEAVPLLISIMEGRLNPSIRSILDRDTESFPIEIADQIRYRHFTKIQFNAMVALGLVGNPEAIPAIRHVVRTHESESFAVEGAIALALLGDKGSVGLMLERIDTADHRLIEEMFKAVFIISGRNYDIQAVSSIVKKEESLNKLRDWVRKNPDYEALRPDVLRRRKTGPAVAQLSTGTLRGALRATKSFANYDDRYSARQFLRANAKQMSSDLSAIVLDETEDLDIRFAAMEWYAASDPDDAEDDLKRARKRTSDDRVIQKAEAVLEDIDEYKDAN